MPKWIAGILLAACMLAGCDQRALLDEITPKEEAEFAKQYIALFQKRDFAAIEAKIDPSLKTDQLRAKLMQMASALPPEPPISIEVVGANITRYANGMRNVALTFQYQFPKAWLGADIALQKIGDVTTVTGVTFTPLPASLQVINAFTLEGKSLSSYAILTASILIPIFILLSFIVCLVTKVPKRKWLWCIFVLLGLTKVTLIWTTGQINFTPIFVSVVGVPFGRLGPVGPYYFVATFPIGAILFWIRRRHWIRDQSSGTPIDELINRF